MTETFKVYMIYQKLGYKNKPVYFLAQKFDKLYWVKDKNSNYVLKFKHKDLCDSYMKLNEDYIIKRKDVEEYGIVSMDILDNKLTKDYFLEKIRKGYDIYRKMCNDSSEYDYLCDIVGVVTYDEEISIKCVLNVAIAIDSILERKQCELFKNDDRYEKYIMTLNLPFLYPALNWGSSIRFPWFDAGNGNFGTNPYKAFEIFDHKEVCPVDVIQTSEEVVSFFEAFREYFIEVNNTTINDNKDEIELKMKINSVWELRYD